MMPLRSRHALGIALTLAIFTAPAAGAAEKSSLPASAAPRPGAPIGAAVRRGPDLRIDKVWIAPYNPADPGFKNLVPLAGNPPQGQKIVFVCDLTNLGPDVTSLWGLGFSVDGVMVWNNSWGPLATGAKLRGIGPYVPEAQGAHTLKVVLDYEDKLHDRNPANNTATIGFTVAPRLQVRPQGGKSTP